MDIIAQLKIERKGNTAGKRTEYGYASVSGTTRAKDHQGTADDDCRRRGRYLLSLRGTVGTEHG